MINYVYQYCCYLQAYLQVNATSLCVVGALVYLLKAHLLQPHQCQSVQLFLKLQQAALL